MRLSEIKGERALDVIADIIEPISEIMADKEVAKTMRSGKKSKAISLAIKNHKKAVVEVLAALDGKSVDEYECNILSLPKQILDIVNDPAVIELFTSQTQQTSTPFGSATENIVVSEN